jgi:hypothetical protein
MRPVPAESNLSPIPLKLGGAVAVIDQTFRSRSRILGLNHQWQSGDLQTKVEHPTFASRQVERAD